MSIGQSWTDVIKIAIIIYEMIAFFLLLMIDRSGNGGIVESYFLTDFNL